MEIETIDIDKIENISREVIHLMVAIVIAEENLEEENRNNPPIKYKETIYSKYVKRFIDIVLSIAILIITLPINIVIAMITLILQGIPLFYEDVRVGKDGKEFNLIKIRSMTNKTNTKGELLSPDMRVTKWGKFIRETSLDELLNFYSVLKGDMSIIGPRPLHPEYMKRYSDRHKMRHKVRPGLECPMIDNSIKSPTWYEQFENDVYYVENVSLLLDCKQLMSLMKMVFNRDLRKRSAASNRGGFMGYTKAGQSINAKMVPKEFVDKAINMID